MPCASRQLQHRVGPTLASQSAAHSTQRRVPLAPKRTPEHKLNQKCKQYLTVTLKTCKVKLQRSTSCTTLQDVVQKPVSPGKGRQDRPVAMSAKRQLQLNYFDKPCSASEGTVCSMASKGAACSILTTCSVCTQSTARPTRDARPCTTEHILV
jgi:hypothetical protein